jgi:excisionase family DNA binding protein
MPPAALKPNEVRAFHVKTAAALYGLSRSSLYKLMAAGKLRTVKVGGRRLIPRDAIEALIATDAGERIAGSVSEPTALTSPVVRPQTA